MVIAIILATLLEEGRPVILQWSKVPVSETQAAAEMHSAGLSLFITEPSVYTCTMHCVSRPWAMSWSGDQRKGSVGQQLFHGPAALYWGMSMER